MFTLIVTWLVFNQAPYGYQTAFSSAKACEVARQQVLAEGRRLRAENEREASGPAKETAPGWSVGPINPGPPPQVTAICVQR